MLEVIVQAHELGVKTRLPLNQKTIKVMSHHCRTIVAPQAHHWRAPQAHCYTVVANFLPTTLELPSLHPDGDRETLELPSLHPDWDRDRPSRPCSSFSPSSSSPHHCLVSDVHGMFYEDAGLTAAMTSVASAGVDQWNVAQWDLV